jgi:hypothetical protein
MKKLLVTLIILSISLSLNGLVYAQDFTNESLQGKYAVKASISPRIVGMGVATVDENGNLTVSGTINGPALFDRRTVSTISIEATLDVNPDGTGIATYVNGSSEDPGADFVIMEAEVVDGVKLAIEIFGVDRSSVVLGFPSTFIYRRLPD